MGHSFREVALSKQPRVLSTVISSVPVQASNGLLEKE